MIRCTAFPKADPCTELETLNAELADAEKRLQATDDDGRKVVSTQIKQIKRDIRQYSTRLKVRKGEQNETIPKAAANNARG